MIGRVLLAALLAGIAAGFFLGIFTETRLVPFILQAETMEAAAPTHSHDDKAPEHKHDINAWAPQDGSERMIFTLATSMLAGAGFAAMLAGLSFVLAIPITRANGIIWGLLGFAAVSLAPAAGLPPELPGMPAADLVDRQIWWVSTIACTGAALWLATQRREIWAITLGFALAMLPHFIGAPIANAHQSDIDGWLIQHFVANSLAINAMFWVLIGVFLGLALDKFRKEAEA